MKYLREARRLLRCNLRALAAFELAYKAATTLVLLPLLLGGVQLIARVSGHPYLTPDNLLSFLLNPLTLLALLVLLVLAAACAMVDIGAVVFALDQSEQGQKVGVGQMLRFSLANATRVLQRRNILLVPVVLLLLPLVNIGLASSFLSTISIPEFILDFIFDRKLLALLFCLLMLGLTALAVRWLYAFHYFTLEGCDFPTARRRSLALGRGTRLKDFALLFLLQLGFALFYILLLLLALALASLLGKLCSGIFLLRWLSSSFIWLTLVLMLAVIAALAVPVGYSCVSLLYYRRKAERGESVVHSKAPAPHPSGRAGRLFHVALSVAPVLGCLVLGFLLSTGRINPQIEYLRTTQVTAHRGASARYPENTMAAFEGAQQLGADWVELDVQQSRDGQIFVLHDSNLKRTTGRDADVWELDYAEIARLDAGSSFSPAFAGEHIPLLREVLEFAKETGIRLNIELKPSGHERDFEACVAREIRDAGMADNCVVTSLHYDVLERMKACDPGLTTAYVMSLAFGNIDQLDCADHFSVEAGSVTRKLVSRVHNAGKEIYAWTVNTRQGMERLIELNVDNLITDDIELARQCINESRYSTLLERYIRLLR